MSTKRRRVLLTVAYDGTDFCGWAPQREHRTVHGILTEAVRQVSGEDNEIVGASRTDSGAHALGQRCHFDTDVPIPTERWPLIVNRLLPPDLRLRKARGVPSEFHARFCAQARHYRYRIHCSEPDPLQTRFAFEYDRPLDLEAMKLAARALVGEHDFRAFSEQVPSEANTRRTLFAVDVRRVRGQFWIDAVASAFVRGMMRRVSGALWNVGRGYWKPEVVAELLAAETRDRVTWPVVLPAHGLTLMRVVYGRRPRDIRETSEQLIDFQKGEDREE